MSIICANCNRTRDEFIRTAQGPAWCLDCADRFGSLSARMEAARIRRAAAGSSTAVTETATESGSSPGDFLRNEKNTNRKEILP